MPESNGNSLDLLLKSLLTVIERLEDKVGKLDEETRREFEQLKKDIQKLQEIAEHQEIIETLSHNVSPEGLKKLITDVEDNSEFRVKTLAARTVMAKVWGVVWKVSIPIILFLMGVAWWILRTYFFVKPAG